MNERSRGFAFAFAFWPGLAVVALMSGATAHCQTPRQPAVAPGPGEPDWKAVLKDRYGLSMFGDLLNPVRTAPEAVPGTFRKAGPGPVRFAPVIALGLATRTRGGWYRAAADSAANGPAPRKLELWSYVYKNTAEDALAAGHAPPPRAAGSTVEFDPGAGPFGLWVSNDGLRDGGVFSEPGLVKRSNARLAKQPYKAMIYPNRDKAAGTIVPHSYLIGWEYSTNDDFQDVVCQIDNVELIVDK